MDTTATTLERLERRFWQSMVDHQTDVALALLTEPACMVSAHGAMKFDHADYRRMAGQDAMVLKSFELRDMQVFLPREDVAILMYRVDQTLAFKDRPNTVSQLMNDTSTWLRIGNDWRCAAHTETPADTQAPGGR